MFLVFFSHLFRLPLDRDFLFILGRIGVAGFFFMSGYLAFASLGKRSSKAFLWNRFMRIYPIYWLLLLMSFFLSDSNDYIGLAWNFTLFEEFVGYEWILGGAWMLPIMVVLFVLLAVFRNCKNYDGLFYLSCVGSIAIGALRYATGKPFPTALCLLMCVGLLGYMQKQCGESISKGLVRKFLIFEVTLVIASILSYGHRVYWYFIAYNLSFLTFYLFQRYKCSLPAFERLGELGFTFFLGAGISVKLFSLLYPAIYDLNCYVFSIAQFLLTYLFSYIITRWCENPLLAWGKSVEKKL